MSDLAELTDPQRPMLQRWHGRVMHDLVKYLEMMPRSIDWDALQDDDLESLHESIYETRRDRQGVTSARQLFEATLGDLDAGLHASLPIVAETRARLLALEEATPALLDAPADDLDTELIRARLFAIGDGLRAFGARLERGR